MGYEEDAKEIMRKFKMQYQQQNQNRSSEIPNAVVNEGISREPVVDISNIINKQNPNIQHNPIPNTTYTPAPRKADIPTSGGTCSQCKTIHPPLRPGEDCPLAPKDTSSHNVDDNSVNKFVVDIRNMVLSQMDKKKITDGKRFFQFTVLELMKILESYTK